jgi:hypothetical protein
MKMDIKVKPPVFLIEKNKFLAKKRNSSPTILTNLSTSNSPNKKKIEEGPKEISFQLPKEPIKNLINIQTINQTILKNVKWTKNEDNILINCINRFGEGKWNEMERCFIGRTRKQIRQRYINNIKMKKISENMNQTITLNSSSSSINEKIIDEKHSFIWNDKLDKILLREYFLNKKSWVKISKKIPGSSENSVKNRFYSLLRQMVNNEKKEYKSNFYFNSAYFTNENINNNLALLIYKEIFGNEINSEKDYNNLLEKKKMLFKDFKLNSEYFHNKSQRKNYSVKILLTFLPELLERKGIDIMDILNELNQRKNNAAIQIFVVIEKHFNCIKCDNNSGMTADAVFDNLKNAQTEKLGKVIRNMKLKIMSKYFHRFRYNTLGI